MKIGLILGGLALGGMAVVMGQVEATALPGGDEGGVAAGADVIVGAIPNYSKYGSVVQGADTIMAYSFGSTSCNIGSQQLDWVAGTNQHPVIPQNVYRIKNGRIQQVGMSWCKHGFCALQQTLCGSCQPAGAGCPSLLGIGCSDPYDSSLNGDQSGLGPRSQINASSGYFPYPWSAPSAPAIIGRRVQVNKNDFDPALNAGAVYVAECQYIHPDDAAAGNGDNNASFRTFTIGSFTSGAYSLTLTGSTIQQKSAITHWKTVQPTVTVQKITVPGDGTFYVAYDVTAIAGGWHYEYAFYNLNSDRSGAGMTFQNVFPWMGVSNKTFVDIAYHSGEPYNGIDWGWSNLGGNLTCACTETFAANPNANALRWATLYNIAFDSTRPPVTGSGSIALFKTGSPDSVSFTAKVPDPGILGDYNYDGHVDGADLGYGIAQWGTAGGDLNGDNITDGADLGLIIANWG